MHTKNTISVVVAVAVIMAISLIVGFISTPKQAKADNGYPYNFPKSATSTLETVSTTNADILATSTARLWAEVSNNSANAIFCTFNGNPATTGQGFIVSASTTMTLNQPALYTGALNCITQAGTASVWVEAVQ